MFHAPLSAGNSVLDLLQSDSFQAQMKLVELWPAIDPALARSRAYRKEIERFVLWLVAENLTITTADSSHVLAYREFLARPEPVSLWVATPPRPRFKNGSINSDWRPFAGPLKQSSIKQAAAILHGFFQFLVAQGRCTFNPWKRSGRYRRQPIESKRPAADAGQLLGAVFEFCRKQCLAGDPARRAALRDVWLLATCYLTGLSVTELLSLRMSNLFQNSTGWWLKVGVSGSVVVATPVGPELLTLMRKYREAVALPALPVLGEQDIPLVGDSRSGMRPLSGSAAYKIAREVFKGASLLASDVTIADELLRLTPTRFQSIARGCLRKHLGYAAESTEYRDGLRGVPSYALMQLSLRHTLPQSSNIG